MPLVLWRRRYHGATPIIPATEVKGRHMPETTPTYKPFINKLTEGEALPPGFDTWGFKIVRGDLTTYMLPSGQRYQWPHPSQGNPATVEDPSASGTATCPSPTVGGFAIAKTLRGAAAGGYGYGPLLLVAYNSADVLAEDTGKVRVGRAAVVKVFHSAIYMDSAGYDLSGADLRGLRLTGVNFAGANLTGARLAGAQLETGHFEGANCTGANFSRAGLAAADFSGAKLNGTQGHNASARQARFGLADFTRSDWSGADFAYASFDGTDLSGANFSRACLIGAAGQPKQVGSMTLAYAVLGSTSQSHPFRTISVPAGRADILAALKAAGVLATMERRSI